MRIALLATALISAFGQSGAQSFAGVWAADLSGQTHVRLELMATNGLLGGQIRLGAVQFGRQGTIEDVLKTAQDATPTPVFDVTLRDGVLGFARKDGDSIDRFELELFDGEGKLTFLLTPDMRDELSSQGISTIRPVTLKRISR